MKKLFSLLTVLMLCAALIPAALCETVATDEAADAARTVMAAQVYVSITDDTGALALAYQPISTVDCDDDGVITIHDALACAHTAAHPDGEAAYATANTEWGLSLMKLWGVENGGSYGYYLNDASAWSLTDPIAEGDHVKAYVFTDLTNFSDTYCYFDAAVVEAKAGGTVTLTLNAAAFDENYAPITLPVEGATLIVDGAATEVVTDAEGKATLTFAEAGAYIVTADSQTMNLVDPVCVVNVQ